MTSTAAAHKAAAFVVRWQVIWFALLAPLFLLPPLGRPLVLLILLLPLVWLIGLGKGLEALPLTALNGSLALMTVMVGVSLWATFDIAFSASKVLGVVIGIAFFFGTVAVLRGSGRIALALEVFIAAGTALAIIGLLGTNWIGKVAFAQKITARIPALIRGVPGQTEGFQPNAVAGALVMFIPLQIASVMRSKSGSLRRFLHVIALAITGGTLVLTQSRGAWIGLAVGLCTWALWQGRRSRVTVLAAVLFAGIALGLSWSHVRPLIDNVAGGRIRADTTERIELWSRAIEGIQDFPITGMGMNVFRRLMPLLYPTKGASPDNDIAHAHNHLLQVALDLGLPGLVAYLGLWLGAAALLTEAIRKSTDADARRAVGGLAAGMIAYFVFGTADTIALGAKVGIFFWIALALIVATQESVMDRPTVDVPDRRKVGNWRSTTS